MKSAVIQLETITCPSCILKIEGVLKNLEGIEVESIKVSFNASKVKVDFQEEEITLENIEKAITKVGYEVLKSKVKP